LQLHNQLSGSDLKYEGSAAFAERVGLDLALFAGHSIALVF